MLGSDEGVPKEDLEVNSWEQVIARIKQASSAGQLYNANPASSGIVHFWRSQVLESLKQQKIAEPERPLTLWQREFPGFILKVTRLCQLASLSFLC